jgi:hypothetical protein
MPVDTTTGNKRSRLPRLLAANDFSASPNPQPRGSPRPMAIGAAMEVTGAGIDGVGRS